MFPVHAERFVILKGLSAKLAGGREQVGNDLLRPGTLRKDAVERGLMVDHRRYNLAEQASDLLQLPDMISDARCHRGGRRIGLAQALVGSREVVVQEVEAHGSG